MKLKITIRKLHKWIGLILATQFFIWAGSGLIMSLLPWSLISASHNTTALQADVISEQKALSLKELLKNIDYPINKVSLANGSRGLVYTVTNEKSESHYYNASTGIELPLLDEEKAKAIANNIYAGDENILMTEFDQNTKRWKVTFDGWESTTIHIAGKSGDIIGKTNSYRSIFITVFNFHKMDYERGIVNN